MKGSLFIKSFVYSAVAICFIISCGTKRYAYAPITFDMPTPELQGYESLTLWHSPNTYVSCVPTSSSVFGIWSLKADTLICMPKIMYSEYNGEFTYDLIDPNDTTVRSIPQQYILNKDTLKDVTDYSIVFKSMESELGIKIRFGDGPGTVLLKNR